MKTHEVKNQWWRNKAKHGLGLGGIDSWIVWSCALTAQRTRSVKRRQQRREYNNAKRRETTALARLTCTDRAHRCSNEPHCSHANQRRNPKREREDDETGGARTCRRKWSTSSNWQLGYCCCRKDRSNNMQSEMTKRHQDKC